MDLMELYQLKMNHCATEQVWAMTTYAIMCFFFINSKAEKLAPFKTELAVTIIVMAGILFGGYIISRHMIYLAYDLRLNQLMEQLAIAGDLLPPPTSGAGKKAALWSGVSFYLLIVLTMTSAAIMAFLAKKENSGRKENRENLTRAESANA